MLSKKILFNRVTQKIVSSMTSAPLIRRTITPTYLSKMSFNTTNEDKGLDPSKLDEPKWMKFFRGMEPNPIDLERAVKCDNVEMLNNYVKMNYIGFNFTQLVIVLGSLTKIWTTSSRIFTEIKLRIVGEKFESNKKIMYLLFSGGKDLILRDGMMKKFMSLELDKYFDEYTHIEQAEIIQFMFEADVVKTSRVLQYLSFYNDFVKDNKIAEYFDERSYQEIAIELRVFQTICKNLTPESFDKFVDKQLLSIFANKVLDLLSTSKNLQEKPFYYDFEPQLPEGVPAFFTPEQEIRYKNQLAQNIFLRYNTEQNLGIYMINKREKNVYKLLKDTFSPGDRYLIEVPCYAVSQQICQKNIEGERFDLILLSYLSKFGIVDLNYMDGVLETLRMTFKTVSKRGRLERPLIVFLLTRWRQLTELNFDESFKSVDSSEKQIITFMKSEMAKLFERFINEINSSSDLMLSKLCEIITKAPTKTQDDKLKLSDDETNEINAKALDIEGESLLEALREEIGGEDKEVPKPVLANDVMDSNGEEGKGKETNKYKQMLDMIPEKIKNLENQLEKNEFVRLNYYDKILSDSDTEIISDYVNIIDAIPRFFLYDAMTDSLIAEIKKYFLRKEHEIILESFLYFPNLLESLVLIDHLAKDYYHKVGGNDGGVFPDKLRVRVYQEKRKIDDLFAQYQGRRSELLKVVGERFGERAQRSKEVKLNTRDHYDTLLNISKLELVVNKNKDKYQKDIDWVKTQESIIKYKYTNARDITEVYSESEDNLYIKCLNTSAFHRTVNNSYLKKVVARTLTKMGVQFKQDYCDFPFVADFLLVLAEDQKIILQVTDPEKLLLGVDNVRTIDSRVDDFGFSRHGYTIINFRAQDYDLDEEAMMEKIRSAIKANT